MDTPQPSDSSGRHLVSADDLDKQTIGKLLARAKELVCMQCRVPPRAPFITGLLFLQSSLRTRLGFAVATSRLGGLPIDVEALRYQREMTKAESLADTLRVMTGMADIVVLRMPQPLDRDVLRQYAVVPVINGGDGNGHHPTQSLIDLFALQRSLGNIEGLRIGICGDLTGRTARSLLTVLSHFSPREIRLMAPPSRRFEQEAIPLPLRNVTIQADDLCCEDLDAIYMTGLPEFKGNDVLTASQRAAFSLDERRFASMPAKSIVLSPMPVIDEITPKAFLDPRVRIYEQSDDGIAVRMAVLEHLLDQ